MDHFEKMQVITKFESLPNELLLQCFGHLHVVDIFHSFDYLNSRFSALIRSIALHLDVGNVEKSKLTQFGIKLMLNPLMKDQIISLTLKKKEELDNLQTLFSFVSLFEFTQLRALIFGELHTLLIDQTSSMLPLLPNLRYFSVENKSYWQDRILRSLSSSTVRTLLLTKIPDHISLDHSFTFLTHLSVSSCSVNGLCQFFTHSPTLQCVKIKQLFRTYDTSSDQSQVQDEQANNLERLVVDSYHGNFQTFEVLLQQTPSLRFLVLNSSGDMDMIDGNRWRKLIRDTLPLLDNFKFIFRCSLEDDDHRMTADKFRPFQNSFWSDQHHWYTECAINEKKVCIYTVPYMLDSYEIMCNAKRYYSHPLKSADAFAKVTNLEVNIAAMTDLDQYYFPNVKSLALNNECAAADHDYAYLKHKHISYLRSMVNLAHVTHLEISSTFRWKSSSVILQLIKEAVHLLSLQTDKSILFQLLKNHELCQCLKMIKKLDIADFVPVMHSNGEDMAKICQIFCNMEDFRCKIDEVNALQATIDQLSKLSHMRSFSYKTSRAYCGDYWLKAHQPELDLYSFKIHCEYHGFIFDDDDNYYGFSDDDDYDFSDID